MGTALNTSKYIPKPSISAWAPRSAHLQLSVFRISQITRCYSRRALSLKRLLRALIIPDPVGPQSSYCSLQTRHMNSVVFYIHKRHTEEEPCIHSRSWLQAAEQKRRRLRWSASAGRRAALLGLWKEGGCSRPATHLCSWAGAAAAPRGSVQSLEHTLLPCLVMVCVCVLAAEPSAPNLCRAKGFVPLTVAVFASTPGIVCIR